jgi:probable rRNA maturation factor
MTPQIKKKGHHTVVDLHIDIQVADELEAGNRKTFIPSQQDFEQWIVTALESSNYTLNKAEVSLRVTHAEEIQQLNLQFRNKDKATNVLSFPADIPKELNIPLLGDIVICAEVVKREAAEQDKTELSHWAHMTIHSILHLLGYDHIIETKAEEMEALETDILLALGFDCPY